MIMSAMLGDNAYDNECDVARDNAYDNACDVARYCL